MGDAVTTMISRRSTVINKDLRATFTYGSFTNIYRP